VNDVYSNPSDIDPRLPSCVRGRQQPVNQFAAPWGACHVRALGIPGDGECVPC
jgi:hypothetical protein